MSLPVINYGGSLENDLVGILTSDSESINIIYGIGQYDNVWPGELGYSSSDYIIEVSSDALDDEDLDLRLSMSNNHGTWESIVPIDLFSNIRVTLLIASFVL